MSKVWFVTGSASVLGRNIAEPARNRASRLVATARDPRGLEIWCISTAIEFSRPLDVTYEDPRAYAAVQVAVDAFCLLDVVVITRATRYCTVSSDLISQRFRRSSIPLLWRLHYPRCDWPIHAKQRALHLQFVWCGRPGPPGERWVPCRQWAVGLIHRVLSPRSGSFGFRCVRLNPA